MNNYVVQLSYFEEGAIAGYAQSDFGRIDEPVHDSKDVCEVRSDRACNFNSKGL